MESQELIAAINMALTEMEEQPEDLHEVHLRLLELLNQLRATGANLPSDLVELEKQLAEHVEGVKPKA
ncbi:MAG: hypothetical protein CMM77_12920 [Rhodospirillaceae bacterium]|nr:hypothetical protein [Magnetovibrio sp.]MAY68015.1 hypothetical protein [Rhodospirillaceae bacterium]UTW52024.1 hypothetical protein KFF05_01100 [bacterium SCSIO 12827]|tara:strand:- start:332 stop:535 length:204 start_codon:yes stop_codon:yes gene_type:complete